MLNVMVMCAKGVFELIMVNLAGSRRIKMVVRDVVLMSVLRHMERSENKVSFMRVPIRAFST